MGWSEIPTQIRRPGGLKLTETMIEQSNIPIGAKVLDVGCGSGETVRFLRGKLNMDAVGVDTDEKIVKQCTESGYIFQYTDKFPFADNLFDAVIIECTWSIVEDKTKTIQEIFRVLKPQGKLLLSDVFCQDGKMRSNMMTMRQAQHFLEMNGLQIEQCVQCNEVLMSFYMGILFNCDSLSHYASLTNCGDMFTEPKAITYGYLIATRP